MKPFGGLVWVILGVPQCHSLPPNPPDQPPLQLLSCTCLARALRAWRFLYFPFETRGIQALPEDQPSRHFLYSPHSQALPSVNLFLLLLPAEKPVSTSYPSTSISTSPLPGSLPGLHSSHSHDFVPPQAPCHLTGMSHIYLRMDVRVGGFPGGASG